jgi:hypothetical protein
LRSDVAHFKLETEILGFMCVFEAGEQLEFRYTAPAAVVVTLKERGRLGEDRPGRHGNAVCTAIINRDIEPNIQAEIADCKEGDDVRIAKLQPNTVQQIDRIFNDLRAVSQATVTMFNWTHGRDSPLDPYGASEAWYSEDGNTWCRYSLLRSIGFLVEEATSSIFAKNAKIDEVVRKVEAGAEEPLGRQLFREAWGQVGTNPRSALVIGVTAAEVGLKRLIATLIPGTDWLMDEIPTPPVGKILRKFLPTLQVKAKRVDGGPIMPPRELIRRIEKAIVYRNDVVHAGKPPPTRQELAVMLRAISDFLWMCDIYLGEHWAARHISPETVKDWQPKKS